jgi:hypothetical protein
LAGCTASDCRAPAALQRMLTLASNSSETNTYASCHAHNTPPGHASRHDLYAPARRDLHLVARMHAQVLQRTARVQLAVHTAGRQQLDQRRDDAALRNRQLVLLMRCQVPEGASRGSALRTRKQPQHRAAASGTTWSVSPLPTITDRPCSAPDLAIAS